MKPGALVELKHFVAPHRQPRAQRVVVLVRIGHYGVQAVVAAFQFDQHEQPPVIGCARAQGKPERAERRRRSEEKSAPVHLSW